MSGTRWTLLAAALVAFLVRPANAQQAAANVQWNDAAKKDVSAQVEKTMGAFAAMDLEAFKAGLAEDVVSFEVDLENKPVRLRSRADAVRFAEESFAELKKMGAKLKLDIHTTDCHATTTLAYCTVEFDLVATMADGGAMSQATRNSIVLRKSTDGWKWAHWHSSLAALPASPAP